MDAAPHAGHRDAKPSGKDRAAVASDATGSRTCGGRDCRGGQRRFGGVRHPLPRMRRRGCRRTGSRRRLRLLSPAVQTVAVAEPSVAGPRRRVLRRRPRVLPWCRARRFWRQWPLRRSSRPPARPRPRPPSAPSGFVRDPGRRRFPEAAGGGFVPCDPVATTSPLVAAGDAATVAAAAPVSPVAPSGARPAPRPGTTEPTVAGRRSPDTANVVDSGVGERSCRRAGAPPLRRRSLRQRRAAAGRSARQRRPARRATGQAATHRAHPIPSPQAATGSRRGAPAPASPSAGDARAGAHRPHPAAAGPGGPRARRIHRSSPHLPARPPGVHAGGGGAGEHVMTVHVTPDALGPVTSRAHVGGEGVRVELVRSDGRGPGRAARDPARPAPRPHRRGAVRLARPVVAEPALAAARCAHRCGRELLGQGRDETRPTAAPAASTRTTPSAPADGSTHTIDLIV